MLSWNISGISIDYLNETLSEVVFKCNASLICVQEFDSTHCPDNTLEPYTTSNFRVYRHSGFSSKSRSNAILVRTCLVPLVSSHIGNAIGCCLTLNLGEYVLIIVSIHFPHHDSPFVSFDQALEMLHDLLQMAKDKAIHMKFKTKNIVF